MILIENIDERLERRYSDTGRSLKQIETGIIYDEAIDLVPCKYTYEEVIEEGVE